MCLLLWCGGALQVMTRSRSRGRVTLQALRRIRTGEELQAAGEWMGFHV